MKEDNVKSKPSEEAYSLAKLWRDVSDQYEEEEIENNANDMRDKMLKYKVFNHLVSLAEKIKGYKKNEVSDAIKISEEQHDALFTYTLFLSVNHQFDYSWSYLRKKWDDYLVMLGSICAFVNLFVSHVQTIQENYKQYAGMTFIFANVIEVFLNKETKKVEVKIIWSNFDNLLKISKDYTVSAMIDKALVLSSSLKVKGGEFSLFLEKVSQLIQPIG